jgi:Na+-transporting NADH:ubiquinone oxidoreductase subunit B
VFRCVLLAATPSVLVALYNTGYQANRAIAEYAAVPSPWRGEILRRVGLGEAVADIGPCLAHGALYFVPLLVVAYLGGGFAERLVAQLRGHKVDHSALPVISLLFTLCLPPTLPLWQAALGGLIATLVGKEIFGGVGRNFINPPLAGLAFLYFAYPGRMTGNAVWIAVDGYSGATPLAVAARGGVEGLASAGFSWQQALFGLVPGSLGETSALACAIGLGILLFAGLASWRIVAGGLLGLVAGVAIVQGLHVAQPMAALPWWWHVVSGGFAFGLIFLATDPATAAATNPGRWFYGLLIGALVVVIRVANPAHREGVMLAILLGNVAAPLIDQIVARAMMRRRSSARGA